MRSRQEIEDAKWRLRDSIISAITGKTGEWDNTEWLRDHTLYIFGELSADV